MKIKKTLTITMLTALAMSAVGCQENVDEVFAREAKTFTRKNCPVMIDPFTRMDSMTYDAQSRLIGYHYSINDSLKEEFVASSESFRLRLLKELKNSTDIRTYKESDCSFLYRYRSVENKDSVIVDFLFSPNDYKSLSRANRDSSSEE